MSTAPQRERVASVAFTITGEALTRIARDMWVSYLPKNALELLILGLQGMEEDQALEILMGSAKLVGDGGSLDMVKDKAKEYYGAPLLDPEGMIKVLEEELTTSEVAYNLEMNMWYKYLALGAGSYADPYLPEIADAKRSRMLGLIDQILFVYKIVGKTSADLPLFDIRTPYRIRKQGTDPESEDVEDRLREAVATVIDLHVEGTDPERLVELSKVPYMPPLQLARTGAEVDKIVGPLDSPFQPDLDLSALNAETGERLSQDARMPEVQSAKEYVERTVAFDKVTKKDEAPKPENIAESIYNSGYIDPQGQFYGCPDTEHSWFASIMQDHAVFGSEEVDAQKALDSLGWIKLTMGRFLSIKNTLTQSQLDTIFDYAAVHGEKEIKFNGIMVKLSELDVRN